VSWAVLLRRCNRFDDELGRAACTHSQLVVKEEHWTCCGDDKKLSKVCSARSQAASNLVHPAPQAVQCGIDVDLAQRTGQFVCENGNQKVTFPSGPIGLVTDQVARNEAGHEVISLVFKVSGNSAWSVGAIPEKMVTEESLSNIDEIIFRRSGVSSKLISTSALPKLDLHFKTVCVVLNATTGQISFHVSGMQVVTKSVTSDRFPARICILGFNKTIVSLTSIAHAQQRAAPLGKALSSAAVDPCVYILECVSVCVYARMSGWCVCACVCFVCMFKCMCTCMCVGGSQSGAPAFGIDICFAGLALSVCVCVFLVYVGDWANDRD
jgi:hypothetical protein